MKRGLFALGLIFLSPLARAAPALEFSEALKRMVNTHVQVLTQKTRVEQAKSKLQAADGRFTPSLYLQAQQENAGANHSLAVEANEQVYSVNASWNLFRFGADVQAWHSARQELNYERAVYDDETLSAEDTAATALLNLIQRQRVLKAYQESEDSARHFVEIARERFARSLLSREEADKVAVDMSNVQARRADAEAAFNQAQADVASLLGPQTVQAEWPWKNRLNASAVSDMLQTQSDSTWTLNRPDVLAARFSVEKERREERSLYLAMLPSLDLNYSLGESHLHGEEISSWSTMATLTIPLWSGLKNYSAYRVQEQEKFAAQYRLDQLQREANANLAALQKNFNLSLEQYRSRESSLKIARHILDQDLARFKIGRADANELNLDLSRVTQAQVLAVQGVYRAHVALMQLSHAFGRRMQP